MALFLVAVVLPLRDKHPVLGHSMDRANSINSHPAWANSDANGSYHAGVNGAGNAAQGETQPPIGCAKCSSVTAPLYVLPPHRHSEQGSSAQPGGHQHALPRCNNHHQSQRVSLASGGHPSGEMAVPLCPTCTADGERGFTTQGPNGSRLTWQHDNAVAKSGAHTGAAVSEPPTAAAHAHAPCSPADCSVLVADSDAARRADLVSRLRGCGYLSVASTDLRAVELSAQLLGRTGSDPSKHTSHPCTHLLLLPLALGDSPAARAAQMAQRTVLSLLEKHPQELSCLTVVLVSSGPIPPSVVAEALHSGIGDVLEGPLTSKDVQSLWKVAWRQCLPTRSSADGFAPSEDLADHIVDPPSCLPRRSSCTADAATAAAPSQQPQLASQANTAPPQLLQWVIHRRPEADAELDRQCALAVFHQVLCIVALHHSTTGGQPLGAALLLSLNVEPATYTVSRCPSTQPLPPVFSLPQIAQLMLLQDGEPFTPQSDIYTLGCLLFCMLQPAAASCKQAMLDLRNRILPQAFLQQRPCDAAMVLSMLHPAPAQRPSARDVSSNTLFSQVGAAALTPPPPPPLSFRPRHLGRKMG